MVRSNWASSSRSWPLSRVLLPVLADNRHAQPPQISVQLRDRTFERPCLAAAAGFEAALGAALLAVPAGEEAHGAVEFRFLVGDVAAGGAGGVVGR